MQSASSLDLEVFGRGTEGCGILISRASRRRTDTYIMAANSNFMEGLLRCSAEVGEVRTTI